MGKKILKIGIVVATVLVVIWAFAAITGSTASVRIGASKKAKCRGQFARRRSRNGQLWQPPGVIGPLNSLAQTFAPPLAPVNP